MINSIPRGTFADCATLRGTSSVLLRISSSDRDIDQTQNKIRTKISPPRTEQGKSSHLQLPHLICPRRRKMHGSPTAPPCYPALRKKTAHSPRTSLAVFQPCFARYLSSRTKKRFDVSKFMLSNELETIIYVPGAVQICALHVRQVATRDLTVNSWHFGSSNLIPTVII